MVIEILCIEVLELSSVAEIGTFICSDIRGIDGDISWSWYINIGCQVGSDYGRLDLRIFNQVRVPHEKIRKYFPSHTIINMYLYTSLEIS